MSEHWCRDCKYGYKEGLCSLTGATHTTGIECPSFGQKEKEAEMKCSKCDEEMFEVQGTGTYICGVHGLPDKETEMFKIGDRVRVVDGFMKDNEGVIAELPAKHSDRYIVYISGGRFGIPRQHLEPVVKLGPQDAPPIRTFESGATRDTDQGKLDYVKALSPIVLRRYVQYLDKHRLQPDGSYRDFDNWKSGIPLDVYRSSTGRHFMDAWLLTEGHATSDNHGPVEIQDALCAQLFNIMGQLHELLKTTDRTAPTEGGY